MIIVTDAHISKARGNHKVFYHMLEAIEKTEHDLIFLGDIFDLWVALPRYETDIHSKFIAWCLEQKKNRTIGFLEGNHEYYLASQRGQAFTWCSNDAWWQDDADYEASIWDLSDSEAAGTVTVDYSGTSFLPALVVPIPLIARTKSKACSGLAKQLKLFIVSDEVA